ncbi:MAG: sn-glycerol-3-phosphate ABC transporter ATP-binding protein UgpC [Marinosulfonomonas sp.]|nr:sn-glycerol-3-phosphate ABC transporter ATP-binding protein UgpC [Marinosulfonomonas sp.]
MAEVQLNSISKSYGATTVIDDLDLTIESKEFVALVGPSGSGKSTLLRIIAGLEDISGGTIQLDGRDVTHIDPSDRDMAMVFQSYALYPHMSVAENMTFALRMRKAPEAEVQKRLDQALDILGLRGFEDRKPGQLSGGQRQRVAMGRAIVRQPSVFLFDEPLSNLDAKLRARTRLELRELHDRLGATSIFVTHDQIEAMTMADRIVLLDGGKIQQVGTPKDIYRSPANRFVAGFIGSPEINILTGPLTRDGDELKLNQINLPASKARLKQLEAAGSIGKDVELGIRPEHFEVLKSANDGSLALTVDAIEFTGQDVFVVGQAEGANITLRMDLRRDGKLAESLARGTVLHLAPTKDNWHIFDIDSGLCLTRG